MKQTRLVDLFTKIYLQTSTLHSLAGRVRSAAYKHVSKWFWVWGSSGRAAHLGSCWLWGLCLWSSWLNDFHERASPWWSLSSYIWLVDSGSCNDFAGPGIWRMIGMIRVKLFPGSHVVMKTTDKVLGVKVVNDWPLIFPQRTHSSETTLRHVVSCRKMDTSSQWV